MSNVITPHVLDINPKHGVALVADMPGYGDPRYFKLSDELRAAYDASPRTGDAYYVRQCHAACSQVAQGLVTASLNTPRDGWLRPDAQPTSWSANP